MAIHLPICIVTSCFAKPVRLFPMTCFHGDLFVVYLFTSHSEKSLHPSSLFLPSAIMDQGDTAPQDAPLTEVGQQQVLLHQGSARHNSLIVAAFPWFHGEMLSVTNLSDVVPADQLSQVSGGIYALQRLFASERLHSGC